jgi:hypothetical protein
VDNHHYLGWRVGIKLLCSSTVPEVGTPVPKHVGVGYSSRIVHYELYFLYYCLHSLLDIVSGILEAMFKK